MLAKSESASLFLVGIDCRGNQEKKITNEVWSAVSQIKSWEPAKACDKSEGQQVETDFPISPLDQPSKRSLYYFRLLGIPLLNWWLAGINFFSRAACFCNPWSCRLLVYTCKRWSYGYIAPSVSFSEVRGMNVIKLKFSRFRWQSQSNQRPNLWLGRNGKKANSCLLRKGSAWMGDWWWGICRKIRVKGHPGICSEI